MYGIGSFRSGACQYCNEAALRAVRSGRKSVIQADLEESIEVVIAGYQKKNAILTDKEKMAVAYHEIGHALVAAKQTHSAPVQKITIIPRTSGALGYTMQVEEGNHYLMSREEIENKIATYTGGRVAEEIAISLTCLWTGVRLSLEDVFIGFGHLNASLLINAGVDMAAVSGDMGHSCVATTSNIYCHMFEEARARTGNAIAEALSFDNKSRETKKPTEQKVQSA